MVLFLSSKGQQLTRNNSKTFLANLKRKRASSHSDNQIICRISRICRNRQQRLPPRANRRSSVRGPLDSNPQQPITQMQLQRQQHRQVSNSSSNRIFSQFQPRREQAVPVQSAVENKRRAPVQIVTEQAPALAVRWAISSVVASERSGRSTFRRPRARSMSLSRS